MNKHKHKHEHESEPPQCSIAFAWCDDCKSMHVAMFNADYEIIGMGDIPDLDALIAALQEAKTGFADNRRLQ